MRFTTLLAAVSLTASVALAKTIPACLSDSDAQDLVNGFVQLIGAFTVDLADKILSPDFTDTSSSINFLEASIGAIPGGVTATTLSGTTFQNRADFITAQQSQPSVTLVPLEIFHGCSLITWRWKTSSLTPDTVYGINVMTVAPVGGSACTAPTFQIETNFSEFNAGAWLIDQFSGTCAPPPQTS